MEKRNEVVDLSSFLLVEGSADSEAECEELLKLCKDVIMACDYDNEDDAESCSYNTNSDDASSFLEVEVEVDEADDDHNNNRDFHGKQSWCKIWLENKDSDQYVSIEDGEEANDGTNLSKKIIDQMEDRLFWETCLSVGYS